MPCRDYYADSDSNASFYRQRADELSSMLCEACSLLEYSQHGLQGRLAVWWKKHKEADRAAAAAAKKREDNKRKKKAALNKLTAEEIRLLGILDR